MSVSRAKGLICAHPSPTEAGFATIKLQCLRQSVYKLNVEDGSQESSYKTRADALENHGFCLQFLFLYYTE